MAENASPGQEAQPRSSVIPDRDVPGFDGSQQVSLRDGQVFIDDLPLAEVAIERWELESLQGLNECLRRLEHQEKNRVLEGYPAEELFITNEEYMSRRMWHEDTAFYHGERTSLSDSGEPATESGKLAVPRHLAPDLYVLRDAVVRTYKAPAYAWLLLEEGTQYGAEVLAKHPNAVADVTSDLTLWAWFAPDGSIVGWKSYTK